MKRKLGGPLHADFGRGTIRRCLLGIVATTVVVACSSTAVALGAQKRTLVQSFGSLASPHGIAMDQSTGDLYVADTGNRRILEFDPLGDVLLGFGADVGGSGVDTCTSTCEPGTEGTEPGQFESPQFIAVDNDPTSPSFRDVYVGDPGDNKVSKFNSAGELVASWGSGGQLTGSTTGAGAFGPLAGIAVDAEGDLLVLNEFSEIFKFADGGGFAEEFPVARGTAAKGLAVGAGGNLFKVNVDGSVEELTSAGSAVGTVTPDPNTGTPPAASALNVDPATGDLFVATAEGSLDHYAFGASGEVLEGGGTSCAVVERVGCAPTDSTHTAFAATGLAVSETNADTYLSNPETGQIAVYGPLVTVPDVAASAATDVGPTSARINGTVNPDGVALTSCEFEYVGDAQLKETFGEGFQELVEAGVPADAIFEILASRGACEEPNAAAVGSGTSPVAVHLDLEGLAPGTYHFRLAAANANGSEISAIKAFATATVPAIDEAEVANLTEKSADLTARINPDSGETTYHFEYDTAPYREGEGPHGTSVPVPPQDLGAGAEDVSVSQHIDELSPNVTYHWRVTAENTAGVTTGTDHSFVYATVAKELPDGRAYEMVTPPRKNGSLLGETGGVGLGFNIAVDGNRMIGAAIQCFAGAESCNGHHGDGVGSPFMFSRTPSGWVTTPLAPSAAVFPTNTPWGFAAASGEALFSMGTAPFGEDDFYRREADGSFADIGPITPPGEGPRGPFGGVVSASTQVQTADFSHLAWSTGKSESHWPFDATAERKSASVYEYAGSGNQHPFLVGVTGGMGSTDLVSVCETALGSSTNESAPGILSADGTIVYFTAMKEPGKPCAEGSGANAGIPVTANTLYARIDGERPDARTVQISARSPHGCTTSECLTSAVSDAVFTGASEDGALAYFTSTQQLTDSAGQDPNEEDSAAEHGCSRTIGANGCNLYLYDSHQPAGDELIDVSAGDTSGHGPQVQGVMAISADGSHVYFVAKGVLASNEAPFQGAAKEGEDNLYAYERDAANPNGKTTFIAALPGSDAGQWQETGERSNVTPNGDYLVFVSHGDLTADDSSRSGAQQVFRYDAQTGALIRISVGDEGFNDNGNRSVATPCGAGGCSEDASIAPPSISAYANSRRDLTTSDDGRYVFFTSPLALSPHAADDVRIGTDENGNPSYAQNVYEWHEGRVYLISDGRDASVNKGSPVSCPGARVGAPSSVCLLGSDSSGANVFFSTVDRLVGKDTDTQLDYYDARVCTSSDPCIDESPAEAVVCEGEACQGAAQVPPATPSVASTAPSGGGNFAPPPSHPGVAGRGGTSASVQARKLSKALKACRAKHSRRKRISCERTARRRYPLGSKALARQKGNR